MKLLHVVILMTGLLVLLGYSFCMPPQIQGEEARSAAYADLDPPLTTSRLTMLERRIEIVRGLGRTAEAEELQSLVEKWRDRAIPSVSRQPIDLDLYGGVDLSSLRIRTGSAVASSPWTEDYLIYQGEYVYDSLSVLRKHRPFSLDYDSLGNIYAMVALPDSSIHIFESIDNGVTWVDQMSFSTAIKALMNNIQLIVSDDGPSRIAYTLYIWNGGDGNNLVCATWDMDTWTMLNETQLDSVLAGSITDFHAIRDHYFGDGYTIYVDYQKGDDADDPLIYQTATYDHGVIWEIPFSIQMNSVDPCLASGGYSAGGNLYRAYSYNPTHPDSSELCARVSTNYGFSWQPSVALRYNSGGNNWDPQIAAANTLRGSQLVWCTYTHDSANTGEW